MVHDGGSWTKGSTHRRPRFSPVIFLFARIPVGKFVALSCWNFSTFSPSVGSPSGMLESQTMIENFFHFSFAFSLLAQKICSLIIHSIKIYFHSYNLKLRDLLRETFLFSRLIHAGNIVWEPGGKHDVELREKSLFFASPRISLTRSLIRFACARKTFPLKLFSAGTICL